MLIVKLMENIPWLETIPPTIHMRLVHIAALKSDLTAALTSATESIIIAVHKSDLLVALMAALVPVFEAAVLIITASNLVRSRAVLIRHT